MKLYPPEPSLSLYNEGFGTHDPLIRKPTGLKLSNLLEKIDDPLVIALDGGWGQGKTHFLRRWVGAHKLENEGTATTIYFDAFAHDFLDDPLTGIAWAINERLPHSEKKNAKRDLKEAVAVLARPALRIALASATAGLTEITSNVVDAALAAGSAELEGAVKKFWAREAGKQAAMQHVFDALSSITSENADGVARKLIVIVDELDRCRPDYALSVLEVIKHFFSVPNVHFVLGVNLRALEQSVAARYGENIDAEAYLRRFISLSLKLPDMDDSHDPKAISRIYFLTTAESMELPKDIVECIGRFWDLPGIAQRASIRDTNRILSFIALLPPRRKLLWGYLELLSSLILMKALHPPLYNKAIRSKACLEDIQNFYDVSDADLDRNNALDGRFNHAAMIQVGIWEYLLDPKNSQIDEQFIRAFSQTTSRVQAGLPGKLARDILDDFSFVGTDSSD